MFEEAPSNRRCRTLIANERERKKRVKREILLYLRTGSARGRGRGLVSIQGLSTDFIEIAKYGVPLRGNGANGKEISLGASSRCWTSNTKTRRYILGVLPRINAQTNNRNMKGGEMRFLLEMRVTYSINIFYNLQQGKYGNYELLDYLDCKINLDDNA